MLNNKLAPKRLKGQSTRDGAGVSLKRIFGFHDVPDLDPFLLLDHFGSSNPADYIAGFPWHPHRGIETITYMLSGMVEHADSLGNKGVIGDGDIQWMTAGSGIIHQEMPQKTDRPNSGFQLWVNLPKAYKMTHPKYRGFESKQIPLVKKDGATIKVISGSIDGITGPITDLFVPVDYFDIAVSPGGYVNIPLTAGYKTFVYVYEGSGIFGEEKIACTTHSGYVVHKDIDSLTIHADIDTLKLILASGKPLHEPVSWCGPIVMNTESECDTAFKEYEQGTFVK
jgi:redox-sensitive bicupin YhaK (pirin superfamily)